MNRESGSLPAWVAVAGHLPGRWVLLWTVLVLPRVFPAQAVEAPFRQLDLVPGIQATFDSFGNLTLVETDGGRHLLSFGDGIQDPVFAAGTAEGASHGLRGFSRGADDDGDGLVDEDRLDGRDNDGDGLVDEDFAAIGDAMSVWDAPGGDMALHREYYHWAYDFLKPALFFSATSDGQGRESIRLLLETDFPWNKADLSTTRHSQNGQIQILRTRAWITAVGAGAGEDGDIWLGFKLLGPKSPDAVDRPALGKLTLETGPDPLAGVIVVARSWAQLSSLLCEADQVYLGLKDPVTGKHVPWIVSPSCSLCRLDLQPRCVWTPDGGGGTLSISVGRGTCRIPDPDLLMVNGASLGSPDEILWTGEGRSRISVPWFRYRFSDFLRNRAAPVPPWRLPGEQDNDQARQMVLRYDRTPAPLRDMSPERISDRLLMEGKCLDGCRWKARVEIAPPRPSGEEAGQDRKVQDQDDHPTLAPRLMLGWPNPFRERVQIRCRIPASPREAFAPDLANESFNGPEKKWPVLPWGDGEPTVSVRIYSLNGQEIKALYTGRQGAGEFVVQWDGTDTFGRPVASGPYLCKLQLDDLSLTRRLVYLR